MSDSIINSIDFDNPPDYVFILWSCINRIDVKLPINKATTKFIDNESHKAKIGNTYYYFTGGDHFNEIVKNNYQNIKSDDWPNINGVDDFVNLPDLVQKECLEKEIFSFSHYSIQGRLQNYAMLQYSTDEKYLVDITLQSMISCQSLLEAHNIPYNFGFVIDPFSKPTKFMRKLGFGFIDKRNPLYKFINWKKYIPLNPYNYAVRYNHLESDLVHMTPVGQTAWSKEIKKFIPDTI